MDSQDVPGEDSSIDVRGIVPWFCKSATTKAGARGTSLDIEHLAIPLLVGEQEWPGSKFSSGSQSYTLVDIIKLP